MPGYNDVKVIELIEKWPAVDRPIYKGPKDEAVDSRWLAISIATAYDESPTLTPVTLPSTPVTVAGRVKSITQNIVIEFDGHEQPGIPTVRCNIPGGGNVPGLHLGVIVTVTGTIALLQPNGGHLANIVITSGKIIDIQNGPSFESQ